MTGAQRARRRRVEHAAKHEPKHYLVEALDLMDRIDKAPPKAAKEILHLIGLEAAKRERRLDRLAGG
jgi:hypothetical protein